MRGRWRAGGGTLYQLADDHRALVRSLVAVVGAVAVVAVVAVPGSIAGAAATGATVSFSGALNGSLTTPASDCSGVTAESGEIDFYHSLQGHAGNEWSLFFTAPHGGTWKGTGVASPSSFNLEANGNISVSWTGKSGSFTTNRSSGSVNMVLKPQVGSSGHGLVHVKGTWNCP